MDPIQKEFGRMRKRKRLAHTEVSNTIDAMLKTLQNYKTAFTGDAMEVDMGNAVPKDVSAALEELITNVSDKAQL